MLVPCRKDSESSLDVVAEQARKALIPLSGNVYWYGTDELPADLVDPLRPLVLVPETKSVEILFKALPVAAFQAYLRRHDRIALE